eukprot:4396007-Prymnesium_polylepis.1
MSSTPGSTVPTASSTPSFTTAFATSRVAAEMSFVVVVIVKVDRVEVVIVRRGGRDRSGGAWGADSRSSRLTT